ncbi:hypothetical protein P7C73_g5723, partial [Tremellales sp. Uapishka_1]
MSSPTRSEDQDLSADEKYAGSVTESVSLRQQFTYADSQRLKRKADWRLLPILITAYLIKNMDGNIVSYVKTMNTGEASNILKSLHMTTDQYAFAATCFTVPFIIFEIPSNILIKWSTPRLHFVRIMIVWSIACTCTAASTNIAGFFVCRVFLGAAEAGLYPGILYYLTCWYRADEIAARMAVLSLLGQFSGIIDALLTYGLAFTHGRVHGWQWGFITTGLLGFLAVAWIFFFLPDFPDSPQSRRSIYTEEEGRFMVARLPPNSARSLDKDFDWAGVREVLSSPLLYAYSLLGMCYNSGVTGLGFWLPTIVQGFGLTTKANSQLLSIPPAVVSIVSSLGLAFWLDHDHRIPKPVYIYVGAVGIIAMFAGMIFCESKGGLYALLLPTLDQVAYAFSGMGFVAVLPLRTQSLKGSSGAAFGFAFQNAMAQIPGLYTAQIFRSKYAPRYKVSFIVCIVFLIGMMIATSVVWYFQYDLEKETRRIAKLRRAEGKHNRVLQQDIEG